MKLRNENLHIAMKAYVSAAVEFVAERAKQASDSAGGDDGRVARQDHKEIVKKGSPDYTTATPPRFEFFLRSAL